MFDNVFGYVLRDKGFIGFGNTILSFDEKDAETRLTLHDNG